MRPKRAKFGGLKRVGGAHIGRIAVKVPICRGCGLHHAPGSKPAQCLHCGRMDFMVMDSTGEANRYAQLGLMEKAGLISDLMRQVRFPLYAYNSNIKQPVKVGEYIADFVYLENGKQVIEDFKGALTDVAALKLRHMAAQGLPVKIST